MLKFQRLSIWKSRLTPSDRQLSPNSPYNIQLSAYNSQQSRYVSSTISFMTMDSKDLSKVQKLVKLRVPLLKSPTHFGHYSSRVNRLYNEDKYSANVLTLPEGRTVFNFNIFDGHGGDQCSTFLSNNLSEGIEGADELSLELDGARNDLAKKYWKTIGGYWKRWYKHREDSFKAMQSTLKLSNLEMPPDDLFLRLPVSFLKTDYDFFEQEDNTSGSTCTSALVETVYSSVPGSFQPVYDNYYFNRNSISKLTIAHVGDTKAILVDKMGEAHALTESHHPSNPQEASRLRKFAANFFMTDSFGEERFIALANTRSFGDVNFKQMGVTAEPEVSQYIIGDSACIQQKLTPEEIKNYTIGGLGGDESFLILCTDGVTDVLTDQEIADIGMAHFNMVGHPKATPQACAEEVVKFVEYVGGDDNSTCLVVRLNGWGKWPVLDRTGELRQARMVEFNPRGERG